MDTNQVAAIEYQIAIFLRRAILSSQRSSNLDRAAYLLLRQLEERGPLGVKDLALEFHLDVSTVSRQISSLEQRAWIERTPDPTDHRAASLTITPTGREVLKSEKERRQRLYEQLLHGWSSEELEIFSRLLARLNRTFLD